MASDLPPRCATGIDGLDTVLGGGVMRDRSYMLRGEAGSGKTILACHFLQAGIDADETALFINLEEELADLTANASALGFDVDSIEFLDASPTAEMFTENETYDVFDASDVEQESLVDTVVETVEEIEPDRVVIDPLTQFRYLTSDEYQFRKQSIGLMRFLKRASATVLFTTQETASLPTDELQFISDGTIKLEQTENSRHVMVPKFRGSSTRSGRHAVRITDRGMAVYPELRPGTQRTEFDPEAIPAGVPELDELLDGRVELIFPGTVSPVRLRPGIIRVALAAPRREMDAELRDRRLLLSSGYAVIEFVTENFEYSYGSFPSSSLCGDVRGMFYDLSEC